MSTIAEIRDDELIGGAEVVAVRRGRAAALGGVAVVLAVGWLALVTALAALADLLPFVQDPYLIDAEAIKQPPSWAHWMGTDNLGRDIFSRCVFGARITFLVSFGALAIGLVIGGGLGVIAGYFRGWFESAVMMVTDILLAFPGLVLLLAILTFAGASTRNVTLALGLFAIPGLVRITRASTIQLNERLYVLASRTLGASHRRVLAREILPNIAPALAAMSLLVLGVLIVAEGGLSFLGLGVPLPQPTWGGMIAAGLPDLESAAWITFMPATVLFLTVFAFNVLGEHIRVVLEPKQSRL